VSLVDVVVLLLMMALINRNNSSSSNNLARFMSNIENRLFSWKKEQFFRFSFYDYQFFQAADDKFQSMCRYLCVKTSTTTTTAAAASNTLR